MQKRETDKESQPAREITIVDVADEAGVSYATVSRVINNKDHVKPEKRERVLRAMAQLGYVPNMQARSLAGGESRVVGLLVDYLNGLPIFQPSLLFFRQFDHGAHPFSLS